MNGRWEKDRLAGGAPSRGQTGKLTSFRIRVRTVFARWSATLPRGLALGGLSFILSRATIMGSAPFGLAFLSAAPCGVGAITAGVLISALTAGGVPMAITAVATVALRLLVRAMIDPPRRGEDLRRAAFGENIFLRMATASVAAFAAGLWKLISGGFYFYDLRAAIVSMVLSPVAAGIFEPIFDPAGSSTLGLNIPSAIPRSAGYARGRRKFDLRRLDPNLIITPDRRRDAAALAVAFCAVMALRGEMISGISPAVAAALTITLAVSRGGKGSAISAAICGAILGSPLGAATAAAFAAAGAASALTQEISETGSAALGIVAAALCGAAAGGFSSLLIILPAGLCAMTVHFAVSAYIKAKARPRKRTAENTKFSDEDIAESDSPSARERIRELSDAFGELAGAFFELSERRRNPGGTELRRIADKVSDEICASCPERRRCWELEYDSTLNAFCRLAAAAANGSKNVFKAPRDLPAGCERGELLRLRAAEVASESLRRTLCDERLSLFACDYRAIASILADAAKEDERENRKNDDLTARVSRKFAELGIRAARVDVFGERRLRIDAAGVDLSRCRMKISELHRALESTTGAPLTPPAIEPTGDGMVMRMRSRHRISAEFSAARGAPDREICGDAVIKTENDSGLFYVCICDGMGRGSEAAFTAAVCGVFLRRMLAAGNGVEVSMRLLNSIIRGKGGDECSAGVDILEVDLITGRAALYKGGAAPSYLRRGDKIYSLSTPSVPLGIIGELDAGKTEFAVEPGDVIFMVSDGILSGTDEDEGGSYVWLLDLLASADSRPLEDTARRALRMARIAGSRDDASAAVIAIKDANEFRNVGDA